MEISNCVVVTVNRTPPPELVVLSAKSGTDRAELGAMEVEPEYVVP